MPKGTPLANKLANKNNRNFLNPSIYDFPSSKSDEDEEDTDQNFATPKSQTRTVSTIQLSAPPLAPHSAPLNFMTPIRGDEQERYSNLQADLSYLADSDDEIDDDDESPKSTKQNELRPTRLVFSGEVDESDDESDDEAIQITIDTSTQAAPATNALNPQYLLSVLNINTPPMGSTNPQSDDASHLS